MMRWLTSLCVGLACLSHPAVSAPVSEQASQYCAPADAVRAGLCFPLTSAWFADPTKRYDHAILGDDEEWENLVFEDRNLGSSSITLDADHVFEDIAPRLADLDGDGVPEIIVVTSSLRLGAALSVYQFDGATLVQIAATPFLGQPHRWLAPIGVADFNGDGLQDIAYIEKPHLTKILKIWSFTDGQLTQIADASGLTNHRIGEDYITGGVRTCDSPPEIITVSADWRYIVATRLIDGAPQFDTLGAYTGRASVDAAMTCP